MKADQNDYDIVKELDEMKKDPKKWKEFMATQAEKALEHWPGRKKK
jgi:hypothetical protein